VTKSEILVILVGIAAKESLELRQLMYKGRAALILSLDGRGTVGRIVLWIVDPLGNFVCCH
jgi:hypothetical protein